MLDARNKILLVDDDHRNVFALSAVLRSRGFDCVAAQGAEECLEILNQHKAVNLVLMDMMMPGIDGYHAIALIKQMPEYKELPIIAVTAQAMQGDHEKCLLAGAIDYLSKPVDVDLLLHKLDKYLNLNVTHTR